MPVVRSNVLESGTSTQLLAPLNVRAFPALPDVVQTASVMAPLFPLPDQSFATAPAPSLKL